MRPSRFAHSLRPALLLPALLVGCGGSGPSRQQVEDAMNRWEREHAAEIPTAPQHVRVAEAACSPTMNGIFVCAVTESGGMFIPDSNHVSLRRENDTWTMIAG